MSADNSSLKRLEFAEIAAKRHLAALAGDEKAEEEHTEELDVLWRDMSPEDRQIAENLACSLIRRADNDAALEPKP